ncbi:MAG: sulfatase [Verrucomicrobiales bacterium]|nr:sulfatase [Verrucomicrobiales bacterium]|tara:strand:+ start:860 stop:2230 length:1371 start_codon:yes stop_codon:yes gene_type:complete
METNLFSRRDLLKTVSAGFGYTAFAGLSAMAAKGYENPLLPKKPHFAARAKRVIFACMRGGPSHVDTIDYKPALARDNGKTTETSRGRKLMESPWTFSQHGQSGLPISELLPHLSKHADKMCLVNGMYADVPSHPECFVQLHTGNFQFVRPSLGAWVLYGLGTENQNLPGFITLSPPARVGGAQNYGSAFLPAVYQGSKIGDLNQNLKDVKFDNLRNKRFTGDLQRKQIDLVQSMNTDLRKKHSDNEQLDGVIQSYELAFRMQSALPQIMKLNDESKSTLKDYGIGGKDTDSFGRQCLYARRMAEAGVRFIELGHASWDQHNGLRGRLQKNCANIDQPLAALLNDLDQRGMLDETLVIWGGEFGRTPHVKRDDGRDHNNSGFSFWMAGGGLKGGLRYGATDEHGIAAVDDRMHFHDLHATILHLMGLDHTQLTYRYAGRDFRLTDVHGDVAHKIIA